MIALILYVVFLSGLAAVICMNASFFSIFLDFFWGRWDESFLHQ